MKKASETTSSDLSNEHEQDLVFYKLFNSQLDEKIPESAFLFQLRDDSEKNRIEEVIFNDLLQHGELNESILEQIFIGNIYCKIYLSNSAQSVPEDAILLEEVFALDKIKFIDSEKLLQQGMNKAITWLAQWLPSSTKQRTNKAIDQISKWLGSIILDLPNFLFANPPWRINFHDKNYWSAYLAEEIDVLKDQLPEITLEAFEYRLFELQSIIGKYTLSPFTYELALLHLLQELLFKYYPSLSQILKQFRIDIKSQPDFLQECCEGDLNFILKKLHENFFADELMQYLLYYKNLMDPEKFAIIFLNMRRILNQFYHLGKLSADIYHDLKKQLNNTMKLNEIKRAVREQNTIIENDKKNKVNAITTFDNRQNLISSLLLNMKKITSFVLYHPIQTVIWSLLTQVTIVTAFSPIYKSNENIIRSETDDLHSTSDSLDDSCMAVKPAFCVSSHDDIGIQSTSSVAANNGSFVVTWMDNPNPRFSIIHYVLARTFDNNGAPISNLLNVTDEKIDQVTPSVANLENGDFVITWLRNTGHSQNIFGKCFYANGTEQADEFSVNVNSTDTDHPKVIGLANNEFMVIWEGISNSTGQGIFARLFHSSPFIPKHEFQINPEAIERLQGSPAAAKGSDGNVMVVWVDHNQNDTNSLIRGRNVTAEGITPTASIQFSDNQTINTLPAITAIENGFIITWQHNQAVEEDSGIYVLRYANRIVEKKFKVNNNSIASPYYAPAISGLANGRFVIVWGTQDRKLYGQRFSSIYVPNGSQFMIYEDYGLANPEPSIAIINDEHFVVTWSFASEPGQEFKGVLGQIMNLIASDNYNGKWFKSEWFKALAMSTPVVLMMAAYAYHSQHEKFKLFCGKKKTITRTQYSNNCLSRFFNRPKKQTPQEIINKLWGEIDEIISSQFDEKIENLSDEAYKAVEEKCLQKIRRRLNQITEIQGAIQPGSNHEKLLINKILQFSAEQNRLILNAQTEEETKEIGTKYLRLIEINCRALELINATGAARLKALMVQQKLLNPDQPIRLEHINIHATEIISPPGAGVFGDDDPENYRETFPQAELTSVSYHTDRLTFESEDEDQFLPQSTTKSVRSCCFNN